MAKPFEIKLKRVGNNLHLRPKGDLDGSSAMQLVNALHEHYNGVGRVYIDTDALGSIFPFGVQIFQKQLNPAHLPLNRLLFVGKKGLAIAPKGSKVIVASEKHVCRCNGKCTECRCSAKSTILPLNSCQEHSRPIMNGLEIKLRCSVKSPLPLFAKEGGFLPLEKGG